LTVSHSLKRLGAVPLPVFIAIVATLFIAQPYMPLVVFEPPLLLPVLNALFISAISFVVAYISARSYLISGSFIPLLLGSAVLTFGSTGLVAGWLMGLGGPNVNVTIHNTGALATSIFHAVSAILAFAGATLQVSSFRKLRLTIAYLGVLVFAALLTMASLQGSIPPFFIQGVGPTLLRQAILGTAVALFALSSILFVRRYFKSKSPILYWYSLALALIAVGLSAVFLQRAVGGPIGWTGRSAQYLGCIYFLISVLTAGRGTGTKERTQ